MNPPGRSAEGISFSGYLLFSVLLFFLPLATVGALNRCQVEEQTRSANSPCIMTKDASYCVESTPMEC